MVIDETEQAQNWHREAAVPTLQEPLRRQGRDRREDQADMGRCARQGSLWRVPVGDTRREPTVSPFSTAERVVSRGTQRRQHEVTATYDGREIDKPYTLYTWSNLADDADVRHLDDPFHRTTVVTYRRSLLRALWRGRLEITLSLIAPHWLMEDVMELDANYRGEAGSPRRRASEATMQQALKRFASSPVPRRVGKP